MSIEKEMKEVISGFNNLMEKHMQVLANQVNSVSEMQIQHKQFLERVEKELIIDADAVGDLLTEHKKFVEDGTNQLASTKKSLEEVYQQARSVTTELNRIMKNC